MTEKTVVLRPDAADLAEFASDYFAAIPPAAGARATAEELAVAYLDQYADLKASGCTFDEAVAAFEPQCRYYV